MTRETISIAANLARVRGRMAEACGRCGRSVEEITLVAVSKTVPAEAIRAAYAEGLRHFAENRIQERESKQEKLADLEASWRFVGHLQSNKVKRAVRVFDRVDSVDSAPLAQKLDSVAAEEGKCLPVLIEVHLGGETTKSGVAEASAALLAEAIVALAHLELRGLMTIPPYCEDPAQARSHFRKLREIRDDLNRACGKWLPVLSMGMSHDFEIAIEEGATEIRVGTAIFGDRGGQE